jgi:hypothetical protein
MRTRWQCLWALVILASVCPLRAEVVCAVLPAANSELASAAGELLEAQLGASPGLRLVSRAEIQAVLTEQILSAAMVAEGTGPRLQLGKLVKADLLVFVKQRGEKKTPGIELTVAETRRGLRLVTEAVVWKSDDIQVLRRLVAAVERGRKMAGRADLKVVAIPPFECRDMALDSEGARRGYARLLEEYLARVPGLAIVEMAEARALAQEVAIGGEAIQRDMPYYVIGTYKTTGREDDRRISITAELLHGEASIHKITPQDRKPEDIAQGLRAVATELLVNMTGASGSASPVVEASLLLVRSDIFARIGEWDQALSLSESALLLEPENARAHLQIVRGSISLMSEGSRGAYRRGRTDYLGRMRHANLALEHLDLLTRQLRLVEEGRTPATRPFTGSISWSEITIEFCHLRGQLWIGSEYDPTADKTGAYAAYRQVCDRRASILLRVLSDERIRAALGSSTEQLILEFVFAARGRARAWDDAAGLKTTRELLENLDAQKATPLIVRVAAVYACYVSDAQRKSFIECLEQSTPQMRLAARFVRIIETATDTGSLAKAREQLRELAVANGLTDQFRGLWQIAYLRVREVAAKAAAVAQPSVMIPHLRLLNENLRLSGESASAQIGDWLVCGPELEILATKRGVCRLDSSQRLILLRDSNVPGAGRLHLEWDGRFVWAASRPAGPIWILDPKEGVVAQFNAVDMPPGIDKVQGELAAVRPGQACFFGYIHPESPVWRNYATLLRVEPRAGTFGKHAETFFEVRQSGWQVGTELKSRQPAWSLTLGLGESNTCIILGGFWGTPLLIDVQARTVGELKGTWPSNVSMIQHGSQVYVGSGWVSTSTQRSAVYRTDASLHSPRLVKDFGERPFGGGVVASGPYYHSMLIHGSQLHLLAAQEDIPGRTPAWVMVDLKSWNASVLVDKWPAEFGRGPFELRLSPSCGLVLLADGKAYQVELPSAASVGRPPADPSPIPVATRPSTQNQVLGFRVVSDTPEAMQLDVDYEYSGDQGAGAYIAGLVLRDGLMLGGSASTVIMDVGRGTARVALKYPGRSPQVKSNKLLLRMYGNRGAFLDRVFDYSKDWVAPTGQDSTTSDR